MAYINARGAELAIDAMASADINRSCQVLSDGSALDITGGAIYAVVKDAEANPITVGTYTQTITSASDGEFSLKIPKAVMTGKEDQDLSYEVRMVLADVDTPLLHGSINILESV